MNKDMCDLKQAAGVLGCDQRTIRRMVAAGDLSPLSGGGHGHKLIFSMEHLRAYAEGADLAVILEKVGRQDATLWPPRLNIASEGLGYWRAVVRLARRSDVGSFVTRAQQLCAARGVRRGRRLLEFLIARRRAADDCTRNTSGKLHVGNRENEAAVKKFYLELPRIAGLLGPSSRDTLDALFPVAGVVVEKDEGHADIERPHAQRLFNSLWRQFEDAVASGEYSDAASFFDPAPDWPLEVRVFLAKWANSFGVIRRQSLAARAASKALANPSAAAVGKVMGISRKQAAQLSNELGRFVAGRRGPPVKPDGRICPACREPVGDDDAECPACGALQ